MTRKSTMRDLALGPRGASNRKRKPGRVAGLAAVLVVLACFGASSASAAVMTVCPSGCRYTQIAPAVAAASSGDTVDVAGGRYHGGFTIDKNLTLRGAGAEKTTIRGGGPVITVGMDGATTEPTVAIRGVTITGGATRSSFGQTNIALGGGVWVPPAANGATGATLTINGSLIMGNTAAPTTTFETGQLCGPSVHCQHAQAGGAGIDSWGKVTVDHTTVRDNQAGGGVTSETDGGGIFSHQGALTVENSVVTGNRVIATPPNGFLAEGAGIMFNPFLNAFLFGPGACIPPAPGCTLVIRNSVVSHNSASLVATFPSFAGGVAIQTDAIAGGIHVGDGIPTTVQNTAIKDNSATATDPQGEPIAIDAGMIVNNSPLVMQNTLIDGNRTTTTSATSADVGPSGNTIELDDGGTISNTTIQGNISRSVSPAGAASTTGALAVLNFSGNPQLVTLQNSVIRGNITESTSATGSATVLGAAVLNNSLLLMRNVKVSHNVGRAEGPTGAAHGGGIWNGVDLSGPPVELTLENTSITKNVLEGSPGISLQGGGLFTTSPVTLTDTVIERNRPDQCVGCSLPPPTATTASHDTQLEATGRQRARMRQTNDVVQDRNHPR